MKLFRTSEYLAGTQGRLRVGQSLLSAGGSPRGMSGEMQPVPPASAPFAPPSPVDVERQRQLSRTSLGIGLLAVSVLLGWIVPVEILSLLAGAGGVILLILGAPAFRSRHTAYVWISVFLFLGAEATVFLLAGNFGATVASLGSNPSGPAAEAQLLSAFDTLFEGGVAAGAVIAVSQGLILFDLEDRFGQILLVAAVIAQIVVSVLLFALVLIPLVHQAITQAFASGTLDPTVIATADEQVRGLSVYSLVNVPPALIFAAAYYWAYRRVTTGLVPPAAPAVPAP